MASTQSDMLSTQPTGTPSFISSIQAHPIVAYFSLVYAGTWLLDLPMVPDKDRIGLFPYTVPLVPRLKRWHS